MRTSRYLIWMFILTLMMNTVQQEVLFVKRKQGQSVDISCTPKQNKGAPVHLSLTHKLVHPKKQVLFMANDESPNMVKFNQLYEGRLTIMDRLNSGWFNVTINHLNPTDSGMYVCEFVSTADPTEQTVYISLELFLLVEGTDCVCQSSSYPAVLYAMSAAVGVLLLILWLSLTNCAKQKKQTQTTTAIYEEMKSGAKVDGRLKNSHPVSTHMEMEETESPVYVNSQENDYASHKRSPRPKRKQVEEACHAPNISMKSTGVPDIDKCPIPF
ncbi:hypothetical protein UPYG_G00103080 [Umbra pygmaea]|uniref:Immunoglobulin V-set domain-containing protein n=1 Tax=Umbra pygmaea TaxID=75934 RepID=A0ABD0X2A7_UMBPY